MHITRQLFTRAAGGLIRMCEEISPNIAKEISNKVDNFLFDCDGNILYWHPNTEKSNCQMFLLFFYRLVELKTIFLSCSLFVLGVLWNANDVIPGSLETVKGLKALVRLGPCLKVE